MADNTEVFTAYGTTFNVSLTVKNGVIVKHTRWVTGVPGSTTRIGSRDETVFNIGGGLVKRSKRARA